MTTETDPLTLLYTCADQWDWPTDTSSNIGWVYSEDLVALNCPRCGASSHTSGKGGELLIVKQHVKLPEKNLLFNCSRSRDYGKQSRSPLIQPPSMMPPPLFFNFPRLASMANKVFALHTWELATLQIAGLICWEQKNRFYNGLNK